MSGVRRVFDKEFKLISIELSNKRTDPGALANELDVPPAMLYRLRREFSAKQNDSFPGTGKVILSEAELVRLRKKLHDTQLERHILKKAEGIFSRSDGIYSGS